MAIKRRRYDAESSQAAGLDYLLRRFERMSTQPASGAKAAGGYTFAGPIEPTFLVASIDARSQIRDVADFVCDGVNDEEEIQYALDALGGNRGIVNLSAGRFYPGNDIALVQINVPTKATLKGRGKHVTTFQSDSTNAAFDFQILYGTDSALLDFSITEIGGI